jgi:hypothetical protein
LAVVVLYGYGVVNMLCGRAAWLVSPLDRRWVSRTRIVGTLVTIIEVVFVVSATARAAAQPLVRAELADAHARRHEHGQRDQKR